MKYQQVCLEAVAYGLPDEIVTSEALEARLAPTYERLRLSAGRLELMTGIRQRRFWPAGTKVGEQSRETAARLLEAADFDRRQVGALVHGSVCRDYLEPATACGVHHGLGLPAECAAYDVSNACLGILNGIVQVANMIELGQIRAGIVVGTEDARPLVENTIRTLNADRSLTREGLKPAIASLTVGSASAAVLLVDRDLSRTGNRLLAATAQAHTAAHELCRGREQAGDSGPAPWMQTDSEALLHAGIAAGARTFDAFLAEAGWTRPDVHKTYCHQVGAAHRKRLLETLALTAENDYATFETLGNTGSAALPVTLGLAIDHGHLQARDHAALLGIGSGINVLMLALDWQRSLAQAERSGRGSAAGAGAYCPLAARLTPGAWPCG